MAQMVASARKYASTHPWLTFQAYLEEAGPDLWLALGEARSKCEHLSWVPLLPPIWERLHTVLLAKGVLATTAIEGNTLSEEEVQRLLAGDLKLPPSKDYLGQEVQNVISAVNAISKAILAGASSRITGEKIRRYNREVLAGLELGPEVVPGEIRCHEVSVALYHGAPAQDCDYLLNRMCEWLNDPVFTPTDHTAIVMGVIRAVLAHLYIAWIHPFGDGNGRTARLVEFEMLVSCGVPSAAAHLLSNHYNQTRQEYYRQLHVASRSGGRVLPFIEYAVGGFVDNLKEQLDWVRYQQRLITWRDYVREMFQGRPGKVNARRQALALSLTGSGGAVVPLARVPELDVSMARAYASRTLRAVSRDLRVLEDMGLVKREPGGYRANWECLAAFVPLRKVPGTGRGA
jgi:Fic family protein